MAEISVRNTCKIVGGRLLEISVAAGYRTVSDVDEMIAMMVAEFERVPEPTRIVISADWRACGVLTPEVAERATAMLTRANSRVERSAILHANDQPTCVMQVLRLAREARLPNRRVFTDQSDMRRWLSEVLNEEEQQRLDLQLNGNPRDSAAHKTRSTRS